MISLADITSFDVIVVLIFVLFAIRGTWIGFMRQLTVFIALIGSYLLAGAYTGQMMPLVSNFIENPKAVFYISFFLLFLFGSIFMLLTGKVLRLVMELTMATWFDRALGCILGLVKGAFVTSLIYMAMNSSLVSSGELLEKSLTSPYLAKGADFIQQIIKDKELRNLFSPKEPAILPEKMPDIQLELPPVFKPTDDQEGQG